MTEQRRQLELPIVVTLMLFLVFVPQFMGPILITPRPAFAEESEQIASVKTYRPSDLKEGEVITPFGIMNKTQVHEYKGRVVDMDSLLTTAHNLLSSDSSKAPQVNGNWNEYVYWFAPSALNSFSGKWIVPAAPTANYLQPPFAEVSYIFIGLQDSPTTRIIQPVLQYGFNGIFAGCQCWQLSSWMVSGGNVYYSTPIPAYTGDVISGNMQRNFGQVWTITTQDVTQGTSTAIQVSTGANFVNAVTTLETYLVSDTCERLPGNMFFTTYQLTEVR